MCPHRARATGETLAERGVHFIDAPVSGGPAGARAQRLYVFMGGEAGVVEAVRPIIEAVAGPHYITHCGPIGSGQIAKGVNQLMMALANAAALEAIAFGVNNGLAPELIARAIGETDPLRQSIAAIARAIAAGESNTIDYKFRELPYFLDDARENGFSLPLTEALHDFCAPGERVTILDKRPAPGFWHELTAAMKKFTPEA
ncbi:MAG: NAD(P)-dependent oxidoreductase [Opitutales bacterium]|nr:NAD(P)-dependent oxidoreductase [Opitutales bacterium]